MKLIPLSEKAGAGKSAIVDDDFIDTGLKWTLNSVGYPYQRVRVGPRALNQRKTVLMHRYVIGAAKGQIVDHINRNKLDCRRENLRICTQSSNVSHAPGWRDGRRNSRFKGVYKTSSGKWFAELRLPSHRSKVVRSTRLNSQEEAAAAYDVLVAQHRDQFAFRNNHGV